MVKAIPKWQVYGCWTHWIFKKVRLKPPEIGLLMVRWFLEAPPAFHDQTSQDSLLPLRKSEWLDDFCSPIKQRIPPFLQRKLDRDSTVDSQHVQVDTIVFKMHLSIFTASIPIGWNAHVIPSRATLTIKSQSRFSGHTRINCNPKALTCFWVVLADFGWLKFH